MADGRITLTDVMLGIDKHGLVSKLTEESFTFLVGMILEHNKIGFAPGFDMTNPQAMAAGGGNTPKSVRRRRLTLSKFRIEGKALLKFYTGNYGKNTCAKYEINYDLLLSYNGVWTSKNGLPDQKGGGGGYSEGPVEGTVVGTVEAPSLDQIRSEESRKNKPEQFSPSADDSESKLSEVDQFIKLLKDKHKLPSDPVYGMVNNMIHKYTLEACVAAMESSKPTSNTWSGILAYISKVAANISAQSRGVSGEKLDKLEAEYRDLYDEVTEYREYFDANEKDFPEHERKESAKWLDRNESKLALARYTIEENGGSLEVRR